MGYCYEVRLLCGTEVVQSWDVNGSYSGIHGKTHPYNVMTKSLNSGILVYKDLRTEVRDSDRWEQTERILTEMLQLLEKERNLHMDFVDTDWEDQMADETL